MTDEEFNELVLKHQASDDICNRLIKNWFENKVTAEQMQELKSLRKQQKDHQFAQTIYNKMNMESTQKAGGFVVGIRSFVECLSDYWWKNITNSESDKS